MNLKYLLTLFSPFLLFTTTAAEDRELSDSTLRLDYIFAGNALHQEIYLDELRTFEGWAGRQKHMDEIPLKGNGQITMKSAKSNTILYTTSFSTLFQEWLGTEEATQTCRAFENVFLLPMPKHDVLIEVQLYNFKNEIIAEFSHRIDPKDIFIRPLIGETAPHRYLKTSPLGKQAIDIAIVAEGYQKDDMETFYKHAKEATEALFSHKPFKRYENRFNIVAVGVPSEEEGVSIPGKNEWKNTALGSHFDTFYSDRYLTTLRLRNLHNALTGIPYEHIIILANTDNYGGGGIYNSYMLTTARHPSFHPVVVHEFGHSFAGLADEYYYDDQFVEYYYPNIEPWEPNITTLKDFNKKWKELLSKETPIPTPKNSNFEVGVFEGGGYQSKGVYRGCKNCRMKTNEAKDFCPVCQHAIERLIRFYTE